MNILKAVILISIFASSSGANAAAYDLTSIGDQWNNCESVGCALGFEFSVNEDILVTELGMFDGAGFSSHEVGIFSDSGGLLVSTTVQSTDASDGNFRYADITDTLLSTGNSYFILGQVTAGVDYTSSLRSGVSFSPEINLLNGAIAWNTSDLLPPTAIYEDEFWMGPNFKFSPVPLPAAAWLFISALGGLVVAKRKQLKT